MRVLVKTPLDPHSGYGNDGIEMVTALQQAGCEVLLDPVHVGTPLPANVAQLLTKRLEPPFDLYLHHWDPPHAGISAAARANSTITAFWSMWEFTSLDNCAGRSKLRRALAGYDLVVGYDGVSSGALRPYVRSTQATVQGGYWPQKWPARPRDWNAKTLQFCMVGALGLRKDPFLAVEAFAELRREHPEVDIALNLKTVVPGLHSKMADAYPGLRVFYEVWPEEVLREFYYSQHVLLAPSRGEGKNLPALEMLSSGGTVIATNFGGHTGWLSSAVGYPLDFELQPLSPATPNCRWAKASKDHLKKMMLDVYNNRDQAARKAQTAAQLIPQMCAWPKAVDRLMDNIATLGDKGQLVVHKYREAKARAEQSKQALW